MTDDDTEAIIEEWDEVTISRYSDVGHRNDDCSYLKGHHRTLDTDADADIIRTRGPLTKCNNCGSDTPVGGASVSNGHLESLLEAAAEDEGGEGEEAHLVAADGGPGGDGT